ncbi:unnamed protein product [Ilex paraguariensis]|uniref:NB-ARC domain-containing protein n=1 Tax=Ilex paraguariensis TaxID=185542 RepID=A0ABC8URT2_9AQUA
MAQSTLELGQGQEILKLLGDNDPGSTVVLVGEPGIGKTWLAKKVCGQAISNGTFGIVLWAYLDKEYNELAIGKSFVRQMSLLSTTKGWEKEDNEEVEEKKEEILDDLMQKISDNVEGKLLLVLDNEGSKMNAEDFMKLLNSMKFSPKPSKVLIISCDADGKHENSDSFRTKKVIKIQPLSPEKLLSIFRQTARTEVLEPRVEQLADGFIKNKVGLTRAKIVLLAKALSNGGISAVRLLERALEESSGDGSCSYTELLHRGYDRVPDGVLLDWSWQGSHFFQDRESIHFGEFIACWIMEGYLGHIDSIEKAYEEGHRVLMELIDCQMLKKVDDENIKGDYLRMAGAVVDLDRRHCSGFGKTASLGLANVFEKGQWDGIGEIVQADGMLKSVSSGKKEKKCSTLLLDGNCLSLEVSTKILQSEEDLRVLALFNPRLITVPLLSSMESLNVLVLRGCNLLEDIRQIQNLKNLSVLEFQELGH